MHENIKKIIDKLEENQAYDLNSLPELLFKIKATKTEAWIILTDKFGVSGEESDEIIMKSKYWNSEPYVDTMYQVALYLHGKESKPEK